MKNLKLFLLSTILFSINYIAVAQGNTEKENPAVQSESKLDFDLGVDLMSRYVWRGLEYSGNGPSIQPSLSMTWSGLEIGFWGAYSTNAINFSQELDLYASYTFFHEYFTLGVTDYFFTNELGNDDFLNYKNDTTGHILEGSFSFNGTKKVPISLLVAVNFYGNDEERIENNPSSADFNKATGLQYSTYLELGYTKELKSVSFEAFAGFNLTNTKSADATTGYIGENGLYGSKAGIVNLGFTFAKKIVITDKFSLPISASIITNPLDKHYYFVFGISL